VGCVYDGTRILVYEFPCILRLSCGSRFITLVSCVETTTLASISPTKIISTNELVIGLFFAYLIVFVSSHYLHFSLHCISTNFFLLCFYTFSSTLSPTSSSFRMCSISLSSCLTPLNAGFTTSPYCWTLILCGLWVLISLAFLVYAVFPTCCARFLLYRILHLSGFSLDFVRV
jgi:hypothetical protein